MLELIISKQVRDTYFNKFISKNKKWKWKETPSYYELKQIHDKIRAGMSEGRHKALDRYELHTRMFGPANTEKMNPNKFYDSRYIRKAKQYVRKIDAFVSAIPLIWHNLKLVHDIGVIRDIYSRYSERKFTLSEAFDSPVLNDQKSKVKHDKKVAKEFYNYFRRRIDFGDRSHEPYHGKRPAKTIKEILLIISDLTKMPLKTIQGYILK